MQRTQHGSTGRTYGRLLHSPQGNFKHVDYKFDTTKLNADFSISQKAAGSTFSEWIKGSAIPSLLETGLIFIDMPHLGTTPQTGSRTNQTLPIFGTGITQIMNQYHSRSKAANRTPTHGLLPSGTSSAVIPLALVGMVGVGGTIPLSGAVGGATRAVTGAISRIRPANLASGMRNNLEKIKALLESSKILELLTFAMTLHNASMLSTSVFQSCVQIVDNILDITGVSNLIVDSEGHKVDVATKLGTTIEGMIKYAIGRNNYAVAKEKWKLYSAVYTAGANILNTMGTMQQATLQVIEVTGNYVGKVGNALKAFGVVGDFYDWMSEAITARSSRYDGLNKALDEAQQFSGDISIVTGSVLSAKQAKDELGTQFGEFQKTLDAASRKVKNEAVARDAASTPPPIKKDEERL